jgi:hypothetical protein
MQKSEAPACRQTEGEEMRSRQLRTILAVLISLLVATALAGWLSMRAIDYFLVGG